VFLSIGTTIAPLQREAYFARWRAAGKEDE